MRFLSYWIFLLSCVLISQASNPSENDPTTITEGKSMTRESSSQHEVDIWRGGYEDVEPAYYGKNGEILPGGGKLKVMSFADFEEGGYSYHPFAPVRARGYEGKTKVIVVNGGSSRYGGSDRYDVIDRYDGMNRGGYEGYNGES